MREENNNLNVALNGNEKMQRDLRLLNNKSVAGIAGIKRSGARSIDRTKSISVGRVKLSKGEKILIFLVGLSLFSALLIILKGRIYSSQLTAQVDITNQSIQQFKQSNQDLNSEVKVLSNSSRLNELAKKYGLELDENRVQNIVK